MKWIKWLPWKLVVRYTARAHGFLDPIALLGRLHHFAQPSEINEPIELLRAGVVLHARGFINSRVIQHNLDWVWPFWVEKQFDPEDNAFIPRAFSLTHINLTHRNWTAIGIPDCEEFPIVDPRGLLTPFLDQWSLDSWIITKDGRSLLPSRSSSRCRRHFLSFEHGLGVTTIIKDNDLFLSLHAHVESKDGRACCRLQIEAHSDSGGWVAVALRPYNPEGVSFINEIALAKNRKSWRIDGHPAVRFSDVVNHHQVSRYRDGDVFLKLHDLKDTMTTRCSVGMATAAALFDLSPSQNRKITVDIPLEQKMTPASRPSWPEALAGRCKLQIPDSRFQFLYEAAQRTLILHSPGDVYPGPYTYKRFWFRDAAFIIHGLLCSGFFERAERAIDLFPGRQKAGYFHSQEGEWDANGEVLWIMQRFCELSNKPPKNSWKKAILKGGRWICEKRLKKEHDSLHAGLMPSGFSAEHLGPNDYYYWDDFWSIAGLQAAAKLMDTFGDNQAAALFRQESNDFSGDVDISLQKVVERISRPAIPASPYRRLDAGAIGSLAVGYPLNLWSPDDHRLLDTADFLIDNCFVYGGFFQDMIHSGINAYLTLHIAQVLLRAGDSRYFQLMEAVARLASPTGQWPEAIHPRTLGGCMGDGQHVWAAAEWILMVRNCFVREEDNQLIMASGIPLSWLHSRGEDEHKLSFGPASTTFGMVSISITVKSASSGDKKKIVVSWHGEWYGQQPQIIVQLSGLTHVAEKHQNSLVINEENCK